MRRVISIFICVSMLISATFSSVSDFVFAYSETSNTIQDEFVEGQALVKFKEELSTSQGGLKFSSIYDDFDYTVVKTWNFNRNFQDTAAENFLTMALVKSDSLSTSELISKFEEQASVDCAKPNYIYHINGDQYTPPNDYNKNVQWGLDTIDVESVWREGVTGSDDIVIAVLDSGVDYNHEDLKDNMWVRPAELEDVLPGNEYGCNFLYDDPQKYPVYFLGYKNQNPLDDNGHGTHCAGILGAAGNNGKGITGVNQNTKIMALKIADGWGNTYAAAAITAYEYMLKAKQNGVNLVAVNNSWSMPGKLDASEPLYEAIEALGKTGVLSVCAAGNSSVNNDASPQLPCGADLPYIISVAAINKSKSLSGSNYGRTTVDVASPGISIRSTISNGSYTYMSGTSMATPFITGSVALLKAYSDKKGLNWSPEEIKARIIGGTVKSNSLKNKTLSDGYFNLGVAIDENKIMPVLNTASFNSKNKTITVDGYFFGNSKGQIKFKDKNLTIKNWSNNKITAELTDNISSGNKYNFTVVNSDGQRSGRNDLSIKVVSSDESTSESSTEAMTSSIVSESTTISSTTTATTTMQKTTSSTQKPTTTTTKASTTTTKASSEAKNDSVTETSTQTTAKLNNVTTIAPNSGSVKKEDTDNSSSVKKEDTDNSSSAKKEDTNNSSSVKKEDTNNSSPVKKEDTDNSSSAKEDTNKSGSIEKDSDKNGFIKEGADKNGFDTWYYYENGTKISGWREIDGHRYYFNPDSGNALQTGWLKTDKGDYYYFDVKASSKSDRISSPSEGLGRMHTGWINDGGKEFYYLDAKSQSFNTGLGKMLVGWFTDGGNEWYYCNPDKTNTLYGKMETGWKLIKQEWYYLDEGKNNANNIGKMHRNWSLINGYWYYFYSSGIMAHNTYINGWYVDENGRWI